MSPLHSHFLHHCSSAMALTTCFQKYFFVGLQFALNVAKEVTHGFHRLVVHVRGNAVLLCGLVATDIVYRRVGCHFRQGEAGLDSRSNIHYMVCVDLLPVAGAPEEKRSLQLRSLLPLMRPSASPNQSLGLFPYQSFILQTQALVVALLLLPAAFVRAEGSEKQV